MSARRTLAAALLGQVLALLIATTAVSSTLLARQGVSAPTLQSSLNYLLLGVVYTAVHVHRHGWRWRCAWWAYALLAALDVEGNFCLVLAYRHTSLTSVTLLDCFTIPMVVALSTALLGAAYRRRHYAGAAVACLGLVLLVVTDRSAGSGSGGGGGGGQAGGNPLLGDGLVLLGATVYALSNVLQEWLLGDVPVEELLGSLGLWGCLWSALQGLPLELHTLLGAAWSPAVAVPFFGFGVAMFAFYSLVPYELRWGGAALLNISLLASDVWSALARYFWLGGFEGNSLLFFAASLAVVAVGIAIYTAAGDVETQLGAGRADALPTVAYQPVPSGGGAGPSPERPGQAKAAMEELRAAHQALREAPPAPLPNPFAQPFELRPAPGLRGAGAGGFMPLPTAGDADDAWHSHLAGGGRDSSPPSTPPPAAAAAAAEPASRAAEGAAQPSSVELASPRAFDRPPSAS